MKPNTDSEIDDSRINHSNSSGARMETEVVQPWPLPDNEEERVSALHALRILDTMPEERFERLTRLATRVFNVPMSAVVLIDAERQWFKSCQGLPLKETSRDISFCAHAILDDSVLVVPDTREDVRFRTNPFVVGKPHFTFYAGCPLSARTGVRLGTLCIGDFSPRTFSNEDQALLKDLAVIAEQEILALQMATTDHLTQLTNRRGFETLGNHALAISRRMNSPSTLLMMDLDEFKVINDLWGHAAGDAALQAFALILRETLRESDVIGRLGGDEFAVLLSDMAVPDANEVIGRIAARVAAYNQTAHESVSLRFSAGVAGYDSALHCSIESLVGAADEAMYRQKRAGQGVGSVLE